MKNLYPCKNVTNERSYLSSICVLWVDVNIEFHSFRQTVFMNTIIPISNILMGFRRNRYTRTSTTFLLVIIETVSVHEYFCAYLTFVWRTSLLQVMKIIKIMEMHQHKQKIITKNIDDGVTFDLILYLFLLIFLFSSFLSGWSATTEVEGIAFNFKRLRFQFDIHRRALKYF